MVGVPSLQPATRLMQAKGLSKPQQHGHPPTVGQLHESDHGHHPGFEPFDHLSVVIFWISMDHRREVERSRGHGVPSKNVTNHAAYHRSFGVLTE